MTTTIRFTTTIRVADETELRNFVHDNSGPDFDGAALTDIIWEGVANPASAPLDTGYEFVQGSGVEKDEESVNDRDGVKYAVNVVMAVHDQDALIKEARSRYQTCWGDQTWFPPTLAAAAYEVVIASNASPAPLDIGFEIIEMIGIDDVALEPPAEDNDADPAP